jgi:hypothetical protein
MAIPWLLLAQLAPLALQGGRSIYDRFQRSRDPQGYDRARILKEKRITPEQYSLSRKNLQQAVDYLGRPQRIFGTQRTGVPQLETVSQEAPGEIGPTQRFGQLGGLASRLRGMEGLAQRGYEGDVGRLTSGFAMQNPLGLKSSRHLGLLQSAYKGRLSGLAKGQLGMLTTFARENAIRDIEGENLGLTRENINRILQRQTGSLVDREREMMQRNILGQRRRDISGANLRNVLEGEREKFAGQRFDIGMRSPYSQQVLPQGV